MMKIHIIGGTYQEVCLHPTWDFKFGSGFRAAAAISKRDAEIILITYFRGNAQEELTHNARVFGFNLDVRERINDIEYQYDHGMAKPRLYPDLASIQKVSTTLTVKHENIIYFQPVELENIDIKCKRLVYDPQSGSNSVPPSKLKIDFTDLAISANLQESKAMLNQRIKCSEEDPAYPFALGKGLLDQERARVVIIKDGPRGAYLITDSHKSFIPMFPSNKIFPIGSGDVFTSVFAYNWFSKDGSKPLEPAIIASCSTAYYCNTTVLPVPEVKKEVREYKKRLTTTGAKGKRFASRRKKRVYLAGPFFSLPQLWMVNETRRCLEDLGFSVFSPLHHVGPLKGPDDVKQIATKDLEGLQGCQGVFALLEGLDAGTVFEVGFARSLKIPVVGFCESVPDYQLTMLCGTDCEIYRDFSTALYKFAATVGQEV